MSNQEKKILLDLDAAFEILKARGQYVPTPKELSDQYDVTTQTLRNWQRVKVAPAVQFIYDFCNDTGLTFEEIVKEV